MWVVPARQPRPGALGPSICKLRIPAPLKLILLLGLCLLAACTQSGSTAPSPGATGGPGEATPEARLPDPGAGGGIFTDVTLPAGILARHRLPTPDLENIVDAVGAGAAFADLDGDGWLDLVVLGGPRSPAGDRRTRAIHGGFHVYRNLGDGRFEDITARSGIPDDSTAVAVAIADIDGDGDRDVYLVDRGPNRLYRNRGDAVFQDITDRAGVGDPLFGVGAVFFDFDGDSDLDLYLTNYLRFDPRDTSYFAPDGYPGPLAYRAEPDVLYRNRGDGTFEDISSLVGLEAHVARGMSVAASDFDEDGDADIFVANDATANFLLISDGGTGLSETGLMSGVALGENGEQTSAMAADVGDMDGDGKLDLAVSDTAFGALYRRHESGLFVDQVMESGIGVACGQYVSWGQNFLDFDNDGDLDLFVANGGLHHLVGWEDLLLQNDGAGWYEDSSDRGGAHFGTRLVSRSSVVGDYDNDGDVDVFVTTLEGQHVLLRNDTPGDSSWITLDLVGRGARDPFGTKLAIDAGGRTFVAESRCPSAYLGQSDPRIHFGLGEGVETVDRIRVVWPDGTSRTLRDVPARQILRIEEVEG